jgi:hypothetical protein
MDILILRYINELQLHTVSFRLQICTAITLSRTFVQSIYHARHAFYNFCCHFHEKIVLNRCDYCDQVLSSYVTSNLLSGIFIEIQFFGITGFFLLAALNIRAIQLNVPDS